MSYLDLDIVLDEELEIPDGEILQELETLMNDEILENADFDESVEIISGISDYEEEIDGDFIP